MGRRRCGLNLGYLLIFLATLFLPALLWPIDQKTSQAIEQEIEKNR